MNSNIVLGGIIGLVIGLIIGWAVAQARVQPAIPGSPDVQTSGAVSQKQLDFRMGMRKLWEDHITWTRLYLVSSANNNPDTNNVAARLLKNQEDIGNAIRPYYGDDAANKLTALLKTHINGAVALIDAAKSGDQNALAKANDDWYKNANEIADFLSQANPNISNDQMRAEMKDHLDLTKQEAVNVLNKNFDEGIADYDKVHTQILGMADTLSGAIIKQFPDKF